MPDGDITWRARQLHEQAGVSQNAMAKLVGVSQSTLASWEQGRTIRCGLYRAEQGRRWRAALRFLEKTSSGMREQGADKTGPNASDGHSCHEMIPSMKLPGDRRAHEDARPK